MLLSRVLRLQRPTLLPARLQTLSTPQNTRHIRSFSSVPRGFSSALRFDTIQPPNGHFEPTDFRFKAVLVVNTASKCTHAGQLKQLQTLHEKYSEQGLIVIAVPSNDFAGQEPGDSDEVLKRYADFGVTFAIANKTPVSGNDAHPFFKRIADKYSSSVAPTWNFDKFLVDHRGDMRAVFPNDTEPLVKEVIVEIEEVLEDATEALKCGQELLEDEEDSDDEDSDEEESDDESEGEDDEENRRYK
ncbi:Glutathione peroxidase BsaA [Phytophthora citrophthora]|uniref:Glutathione peroxidase n=1 Tax=Phytophthora citrophthora TaxID=4793 RepID=A0AAD9G8D5_9STRA|nr:Glutathione peroxidase BsaA [Phytophthora citrophthora]